MSEVQPAYEKPTILLSWDKDAQTVSLKFDTAEFKNWQFVSAVCAMAAEFAKNSGRMAALQHLQVQQAQALQEQEIRRKLRTC